MLLHEADSRTEILIQIQRANKGLQCLSQHGLAAKMASTQQVKTVVREIPQALDEPHGIG